MKQYVTWNQAATVLLTCAGLAVGVVSGVIENVKSRDRELQERINRLEAEYFEQAQEIKSLRRIDHDPFRER